MHPESRAPSSAHDSLPDDAGAPPRGVTRRVFVGRASALAATTAIAGGAAASAVGAAPAGAAPASRARTRRARSAGSGSAGALPDANALHRQGKRLVDYEILELAALLRAGKTSSVEVTQAYLDRIARFNGPFEVYGDNGLYNAFVRIDAAGALAAARAADKQLRGARGFGFGHPDVPLLCGIPMGFKDSIAVKGFRNQDGTPAFAGNVAQQDATVVARVRAQGVVVLGITIASAFSGTTSGTFAGNAWDIDYVPGGSSQGSGVATAGRLAAACFGEETGGSITYPSACNGASGIKPSLGLTPVAGLMPLTPAYDVLGPIARSGADAAVILNAMLGPDAANDPQSLSAPIPFPAIPTATRLGSKPLRGTTIGIPQQDWLRTNAGVQRGVSPQSLYASTHLAIFNRVRAELTAMGATVKEFDIPDIEDVAQNPYFTPLMPTSDPQPTLATVNGTALTPALALTYANRSEIEYIEAVAAFAADKPADQVATLLGNYATRNADGSAGTFDSTAALYAAVPAGARREAELRRRQLAANYAEALDKAGVDFMLIMQLPATIGRRTNASFPLNRAYYQVPNAIAWPLVSFPAGFADGLPVSVQFWGPRFSEPELAQAMIDYQARHPEWHTAVSPDPVARPALRAMSARATAKSETQVAPEYMNDPVATEEALRR